MSTALRAAPLRADPFYVGPSSSSDAPNFLPVAVAGHAYLADLKAGYKRMSVPPLRDPVDYSAEPGEQSLNQAGLWKRNQSDWSLGAGQEFFDDGDSVRNRYWSSKGIDPWTRSRLSLLPDTTSLRSSANTNLKLMTVGAYLYLIDGQSVLYATAPDSATWTAHTGLPAATVQGIATDGTYVYIATNGQVYRATPGTIAAGAAWATLASIDGIYFANGRLLATVASRIVEISAVAAIGGAGQLDTTLTFSRTWVDLTSAPNGIYAAAKSSTRSEVHFIGLASDSSLKAPVVALSLPDGETINAISYYGGAVAIGTTRGLRLALVQSDGSLIFGPVIEITNGCRAFEGQGEFIWFSWSNYDSVSTGLGRANLAKFTDTLVPAYASDLMATTQGTVLSVETFSSKRYFAVSGVGVYGQSANKVASGQLNTGYVRFGIFESKAATALDIRHDPLAGSVETHIVNESGTDSTIASSTTPLSLGPDTWAINAVTGEAFQLLMVLYRSASATTTGPTLRRWTLRALARPKRVKNFIVPLVWKPLVQNSAGTKIPMDLAAERQFIESLEATGLPFTYQEGASSYSVYLKQTEMVPTDWTDDRTELTGIFALTMVTVDPSS